MCLCSEPRSLLYLQILRTLFFEIRVSSWGPVSLAASKVAAILHPLVRLHGLMVLRGRVQYYQGVAGIVYDCRVLQPFGLPVGQSLLPILNAAVSVEFAAMSTLITVALLASFLYVSIEFEEDMSFPMNLFQTWQTLIVGEPTLVDAQVSGQDSVRFVSVSACFLVCNTVLMNIFINVTGASYLQEKRTVAGTFAVERLRICVASTSGNECSSDGATSIP